MAGFSDAPIIQRLAVPAVCLLTGFLSFFSQLVFRSSSLEPGPPSRNETIVFNASLLCLWVSYYRTVTVDPGRYLFRTRVLEAEGRWCRKCAAPKPPRAHHCRACGRCVPKMDHHCPWTGNCVSMTTFPHFLRFLAWANVSLWLLGRLLWQRCRALWEARHEPAYLGPPLCSLCSMAFLVFIWFFTTVALGMMLATTVQGWALNRTTIEGWEIERHEAMSARGWRDWWDVAGPDGEKMRFEKVEFPYDIGFFANMAQAMGTRNVLLWFWPLARHPTISDDETTTGWAWEENGFNRVKGMWPPPDPDKLRRKGKDWPMAKRNFDAELDAMELTSEERKAAFLKRQQQDLKRRKHLVHELEEESDWASDKTDDDDHEVEASRPWANREGETLGDFGVDEDAEEDDDEVPLMELVRRRRVTTRDEVDN